MFFSQAALSVAVLSLSSAFPVNVTGFAKMWRDSVSSLGEYIGESLPNVAIGADGVAADAAWNGFPNKERGPYTDDHAAAEAYSFDHWGVVPEGVNPSKCTVPEGQRPIILIPGTGEQVYDNWAYMGPKLANEEHLCVYSFNHNPYQNSFYAIFEDAKRDDRSFYGSIPASASALSTFVDQILDLTGFSEVDLVGHSQGAGALPFYYLKRLGGASKVRKMISIAPSLGTNGVPWYEQMGAYIDSWGRLSGYILNTVFYFTNSQGTVEQLWDSPFMIDLHDGGPGVPGVQYVNIATKSDTVLVPYTRCRFEPKDGVNVTNLVLQDFCENDYSNHSQVCYSANVYTIVKNYLFDIPFTNITCQKPPRGADIRPDPYPYSTEAPDMSLYNE